jgi:uncharacterized repeat protein (TIGR03806 family)
MKWKILVACGLVCFIAAQSFITDPDSGSQLPSRLSDYPVYEGRPSDLHPSKGFVRYELATTLFTDYAEKERLVKVPAGTSIVVTGDGLPQFPDGTMLVKTFFYWNDKRDTSRGRRIIETRVLLKSGDSWLAGTYLWNAEQNEAVLSGSGSRTAVSWIDETGNVRQIRYQVPSARQCASCHRSDREIVPIGFKTRNLNMDVLRAAAANDRAGAPINQLRWLGDNGVIAPVDPARFSRLPVWNDAAFTLEERARAYMEVNCAHCHNASGFCSQSRFRPGYENSLSETEIPRKKKKILDFVRSGRMPLLGTTIVHEEGLQLLEAYFKTINNEK